jgi:hypothetical protein
MQPSDPRHNDGSIPTEVIATTAHAMAEWVRDPGRADALGPALRRLAAEASRRGVGAAALHGILTRLTTAVIDGDAHRRPVLASLVQACLLAFHATPPSDDG